MQDKESAGSTRVTTRLYGAQVEMMAAQILAGMISSNEQPLSDAVSDAVDWAAEICAYADKKRHES